MKIDLVIFDCDGVLVDSEPITNRILAEMMTAVGLPITTEEVIDRFMGRATTVWLNFMEDRLGSIPPEFLKKFRKRCADVFAEELNPIPGIVEVLDTIPYKYCVASSGPHEKMNVTLKTTNLTPRFEGRIFSAQDVNEGKPAPDIFLYAAKNMGIAPQNCVVIEDTIHGVQAAHAAKMKVLAYSAAEPTEKLAQADVEIFDSMHDLLSLLEELEKNSS